MPIYEYECGACGDRFEAVRKFSDPVLTDCPSCKAPKVKKLLSPAAFVLKGGGWYATDYATGDRKKAMDAEKPAEKTKEAAPAPAGCGGCASGGACPSKG